MNRGFLLIFACIAPFLLNFNSANGQSVTKDKEDARVFVQKFLDWYMVFWSETLKNPGKESVLEAAIKKHPEYFGRELKNAIAIDDNAQLKSGDIVGLDFDPFIGQELWGNFKAVDVKRVGNNFFIDIRNSEKWRTAKEARKSDIREAVELSRKNGRWIIINVIYPPGRGKDILQTLKDLKKDRDTILIKS